MKTNSTAHTGTGRKRRSRRRDLAVVHADAAGIDLGSTDHYVSVPEDRDEQPVRRFGCYTQDLERMAKWLIDCGITTAVMEATGVYWMPVFRVLEQRGLEVLLVNPRHVKHVPGRKSDVSDCQWLRQLHTYGLLRGAFVPAQEVAAMRTYWRQRKELVQGASTAILHMQKVLTQMNLHLHVVLSDITGVSGMKILRAIVAGQRNPKTLAELANRQVKASRDEIAQALTGHYTGEHLFVLEQSLQLFDFYQLKIQECDQHLSRYLSTFPSKADPETMPRHPKGKDNYRRKNQPHFDLRTELYRLTGNDLTRIDGIDAMTAFTVLSEIGFDIQAFPTEAQFTSWLSLCPNNRITGGRVIGRTQKPAHNRAATALRLAAQSLHRADNYLGAYFRRQKARFGSKKAIAITAHKLARIIYRMLQYGDEYVDRGAKHLEYQHHQRMVKSLIKRAKELGYTLIDPQTGECLAH